MKEIFEYVQDKKDKIKQEVLSFTKKPTLLIVQINDDEASNAYIRGKLKDLNEVGMVGIHLKLDKTISQEELLKLLDKYNNDDEIDGIIVQMPLPKQIDEDVIKNYINIEKDVDGFNFNSKLNPATPGGILRYLEDNNYSFDGKNALVIGRSNIVGKPMAKLLLNKNMNVTMTHSHTKFEDLNRFISTSDLIVIAIGKPEFLDEKYSYNNGSIIFDVGINRVEGKLIGDCKKDLGVKFQSPVPRGVGLLTRLSLLMNLMEVYKIKHGI